MEAIPVQQPMLVEVTEKKVDIVVECETLLTLKQFLNRTQVSNYNFSFQL